MSLRALSINLSLGLAAIMMAGCAFGPSGDIIEREEPTSTPAITSTALPPGVTVASVTPQLPPTLLVGPTVGVVVAGTAVVSPPLTSLPGGSPSQTPLPTPQGIPAETLTLTLSDSGSTITLQVGQTILLYLNPPDGSRWIWAVTIADQTIVGPLVGITPPDGAQGYFKALGPGQTQLMAVGDLPCRTDTPPCLAPSRLFEVEIVVK